MTILFVLHAESDDSSAQITETGQCGDNLTYSFFTDGTLVISGTGGMYDYYDNLSPWINYCRSITKIVIGDEVTSLGEWAFIGCVNLKELTIPGSLNSVKSNEHPAFAGCDSIEKVNFTYGTNGSICNYDAYPVNDCWYQNTPWYQSRTSLKEINFTDGIKGIGSDAFRELNITEIVLPDSVVALGNHCFYDCTKLTALTLPVSLNSYGNPTYPAFWGCVAIEKITLTNGNGVPFDYQDVWGNPLYLELTPWSMYTNVAKTIVISDNVTDLGERMFYYCNIKELTIPISLNLGDIRAFEVSTDYHYYNLEKVTFTKGTGRGYDYDHWWDNATKWCPWNMISNIKTITVEEGVTHVGDTTLYNTSVESLILPDTLTSLGEHAFYCSTIKNLTIPISLNATWIEKNPAFYGVSGLEKVTFTPGDGYGFNYAASTGSNCWYELTPWYHCRSTLTSIEFEEGIVRIGTNAFCGLNITSLVIPNSVQTLSDHSFYQCNNLTDLTLPITLDSVASEQYSAFQGCNAITTVRLTAGETGIGWDYTAFVPIWCYPGHCACSITLDSGIVYIGHNTFGGITFVGLDGSILEHTAENLSGHTFNGVNGVLYQVDDIQSPYDLSDTVMGVEFPRNWVPLLDVNQITTNLAYQIRADY